MVAKDYLQEKLRRLKRDIENTEYMLESIETPFIEKGSMEYQQIEEQVTYMDKGLNVIKSTLNRLKGGK